jgi:hypothetical protein
MRPTRDMTRTDEPFWAPDRPSEVNVTMPDEGLWPCCKVRQIELVQFPKGMACTKNDAAITVEW